MYVFHASSEQLNFETAIKLSWFDIRQQLIWNKPHGWSMNHYRMKHEPMFFCSKKWKALNFYGDRTHNSVLDLEWSDEKILKQIKATREAEKEGKNTIWTMKRDPMNDYVHPTQKPVELIGYALANSSKVCDIVLDLFWGSGSTLIACEKHQRVNRSMELDERYVEVIIKRFYQYTGGKKVIRCINRAIDIESIIE